ncbi:S-layer protein [Levilactobacillus brevis]|uniref:S-layer protein n=1 Tax=Levilactobacillus brevis TaxID=1580 RepID=UPI000BEADEA6|nr:S-layer protein [Levilactobacillus brevis]MCZ2118894.1 S-layer protein [Levilactobacillus brevis]MCZ2124465.1 S-layer protein [Levilactobacillus brevis]MCZ2208701.1 S-layer protein [Levilactobacillus brevis]MCZ2324249.1 S-layer protein [Levilactobacillus brevis]
MQSSLKKSLYLGLAALSFASVAAVSTTASAKSAAKVTSDKVLTTDATKRNVNLTGTNAIYTKPGTVKGAKVVATTTTAKNLNKSTTSRENFRAYRVAKTNRGSIYYKVVSYNKVYRGWVYGGKSATAFAGGLTSYDTFKEGTLTADQKNGNYKLANPGKTEAGLTYKQPAWTQYKIGKTIADTTAYKDATFSVDKVGTRTREGDTWVHVVNQNTSDTKADGWILLSNLTQTNALNEATQVKVNIVDLSGNTIKSFNYNVGTTSKDALVAAGVLYDSTSDAKAFGPDFAAAITSATKGTGYTVSADSVNMNNNVKSGSTLTLYAKKGDQAITPIKAFKENGTAAADALVDAKSTAAANETNKSLIVSLPTLTTPFSGVAGADYTSADVQSNLTTNKATTLSTGTLYLPADATIADAASATTTSDPTNTTAYHVVYTFDKALAGSYSTSTPASALYNASLVKGAVADNSNSNTNNGAWGN